MFMTSNIHKITFILDSWLTINPKQQSMTHFSLGKTSLSIIGAVMGVKRALLCINKKFREIFETFYIIPKIP